MGKRGVRLSREAIVGRAVELADAEGLAAVTIRRLAQENAVTPMAMYWHFDDKDSLLDAMAEHLIASVDVPEPTDGPWDGQLRAILAALLAALRPHPAVAGLASARVLATEPGLRLAERVLELLGRAGLDTRRAAEAAMFLVSSVIALVTAAPADRRGPEDEEDAVRQRKARLQALPPSRYPHVVAAAPELANCFDRDGYFDDNLDLLVRGVHGIA
ncbi:TetR/AcrR family transcriptional regulator C-terminal domain-containing protein [Umezawaea tangerina]|uniref:TetR family transcriptional regulator n=1 Tax=Umezawaea tangerina TaxID=84725 RepID=A0A2T0T1F1_9PSEU|nr:TetR/AcrR family transcriptional regulator C-terminal domain-containing protein [Umezawaea tangerina]PRY39443.1 TetR family transcriptional regulator [Umezawaea tangerina]